MHVGFNRVINILIQRIIIVSIIWEYFFMKICKFLTLNAFCVMFYIFEILNL